MSTLSLKETVYLEDQMPDKAEAQIALAGRSNVGKSSLVNKLAGKAGLAKVSSTPGKTRSINFYQVEPEGFYVVDLPGYGYARSSKAERAKWGRLIDLYLRKEGGPAGLALLLDCRLEPQKADLELASFARSLGMPVLGVLTKADKCTQKERSARQSQWGAILDGRKPVITSASTGLGMRELWQALRLMAGAGEEREEGGEDVQ